MSQNFEELYNKLKEEFESSKKDNDEICKEYESTIEMLTESVENFRKEKETLQQKLSKLESEQKKFNKEKESLMNKNKDKIADIQSLNKQNDRLTNEIKRLKEEKSLFDSKIVTLENDNEHYQNKIREYEALAEDLENQLESALEENITLQTEYETFKQNTGDQLIRKDDEIRDIKNDLMNKDKYIQRLKKSGNNALMMKNIQKNFKEGGALNIRRRFTLLPGMPGADGANDTLLKFQKNLASKGILGFDDASERSDATDINERNEKKNNNPNSNRFRARYSLVSPGLGSLVKLVNRKEELKKTNTFGTPTAKKENKYITQMKEKNNQSLRSSKISDKKIDTNTQIDEISENSEKEKEFKDLQICQQKNFDFISLGIQSSNNSAAVPKFRILGQEKVILENLSKLLERIRKRREKLINKQKKANRERIRKLKEK